EPQRHKDTESHGEEALSVKLRASVSPWFKFPGIEESFKSVMKLAYCRIGLPTAQASDTTGVDNSNEAGYIIPLLFHQRYFLTFAGL
ncbi:MAG: hypothetical protein J7502_20185, partial [Flavisolibacter sp.]|nr:hypothetical protein [Flavisolibacter sp.]